MNLFDLIALIICLIALGLLTMAKVIIVKLNKKVWRFGLWTGRISATELKSYSPQILDRADRGKYEWAVMYLRISNLTLLLCVIILILVHILVSVFW